MPEAQAVPLAVAFGAGLASVLSPCVLPLLPTYLTYLAGASMEELDRASGRARLRRRAIGNALAFIAGFSLLFVIFGLSASALGQLAIIYQPLLRKVAGIVVVVFGLHMAGALRLPLLYREARLFGPAAKTATAAGPWRSLVMGVAFSAGWTPCVGPILASVLLFAGTSGNTAAGAVMLLAYSAGLGVPFLLLAATLGGSAGLLARLRRHTGRIQAVSGVLLVVVGLMLYTNYFARLAALFAGRLRF